FGINEGRAGAGEPARGTLVHVVNRHLDTTPYASSKRVCRSPGRNWACCPSPTLVGLTTGAQSNKFPPSGASKMPQCVMVPQGPVASGNKMGILFFLTDGLSTVASSQVVESLITSTRAYALPVGSVKFVPSELGWVVERPMYNVSGTFNGLPPYNASKIAAFCAFVNAICYPLLEIVILSKLVSATCLGPMGTFSRPVGSGLVPTVTSTSSTPCTRLAAWMSAGHTTSSPRPTPARNSPRLSMPPTYRMISSLICSSPSAGYAAVVFTTTWT